MKPLIFFWSLFLLGGATLHGQAQENDWGTGAVLDEELYEQIPLAAPVTHKSDSQLPKQYSLKRYCPTPGNQRNTSTCVGWAMSYGARTMIKAIREDWDNQKDQEKIDATAFSPNFLYNTILANNGEAKCEIGVSLSKGLSFMKKYGTISIQDFPFNEDCHILPTAKQMDRASIYKIKKYGKLSYLKVKDNTKINKIRQYLSQNLPVVGVIKTPINLKYGNHAKNNYVWNPDEGDVTLDMPHALLVVGYDDEKQLVEVMNSWGTAWANNGFLYIRYADFNKYALQLCYIACDDDEEAILLAESQELLPLNASVGFKQLPTDGLGADGNCVPGVIENMVVDKKQQIFKMSNAYAAWTGYQIQLTPHNGIVNMYVFSYNDGGVDLLYPFNENVLKLYEEHYAMGVETAAWMPYQQSTIVIPHVDYCMQLDEQVGTINCVLLSKKSLVIQEVLRTLEQKTGTLMERLQGVFHEQLWLPNENNISWGEKGINFKGSVPEQAVIPIVVDMNHISK